MCEYLLPGESLTMRQLRRGCRRQRAVQLHEEPQQALHLRLLQVQPLVPNPGDQWQPLRHHV
jgi:hypothetical protein